MLVPMGADLPDLLLPADPPAAASASASWSRLLKAIEKNDNVVTAGGLHGKVVGIADDVLTLEIAALKGERVRVKVSRAKIESVQKAKKGEKVEEA